MLTPEQIARLEAITREMHAIESRATNGVLSSADQRQFDRLNNEALKIMGDAGEGGAVEDRGEAITQIEDFLDSTPRGPSAGRNQPHNGPNTINGTGVRVIDPRSARGLALLAQGQSVGSVRFTDEPALPHDSHDHAGALGDAVCDILARKPSAALAGGQDGAGGYMFGFTTSARIIDLARNEAAVTRAGAITVPMPSSEMAMLTVAKDPAASWRGENVEIPPGDPTFGRKMLRAKTLAANVPISQEMVEDAPNAGQVIEGAIVQALALELDRAALRGAGAGEEPLGILNTPNVQKEALGGTPDFDDILDSIGAVENVNGRPNAWILSPLAKAFFAKLKGGDGHYLEAPTDVRALGRFHTKQCPDAEIYTGDFRQVIIGMRTRLSIDVTRLASTADGLGFNTLTVLIRAYLRADVLVARPTHFKVLTGVALA